MEIEYDPAKNTRNQERHGFSFDLAQAFDLDRALIRRDDRRDYGEIRYRAIGPAGDVMGAGFHSARGTATGHFPAPANRKERDEYAKV